MIDNPMCSGRLRAGALAALTAIAIFSFTLPAAAAPARPLAFIKSGDIYVAKADGAASLRMTSSSARETSISWHTDGRRVLFVREGQLGVYSLDVAARRVTKLALREPYDDTGFVPDRTAGVAVSRDGRSLLVAEYNTDSGLFRVVLHDLVSGAATLVSIPSLAEWEPDWVSVGWAHDDRTILLSIYQGDAASQWTVPVTGGNVTRLSLAPDMPGAAAYSPDGKRIAWVQDAGDYGAKAHTLRVSPRTGGFAKVVAYGSRIGEIWWETPAWSNGGGYVYCVTDAGVRRIALSSGGSLLVAKSGREVACWRSAR